MKNAVAKLEVGFSLLLMLVAFADTAHAELAVVPEVDPISMAPRWRFSLAVIW